ncbi:hypothetical protein DNTS_001099 [Danionella cerebrum]|uniref:Uncharacterized protein n=1 Tax=Danionella cerebrum TaxID=2873325 RepID=A0A553Q976_9TELE|nr:hypothetical protein DNTS_001099 [Danionella translucida]
MQEEEPAARFWRRSELTKPAELRTSDGDASTLKSQPVPGSLLHQMLLKEEQDAEPVIRHGLCDMFDIRLFSLYHVN